MKSIKERITYSPINMLYEEAQLPQKIRRSLNLILMGNLFGSLFGTICGGGTTAMIGLADELKASDLAFGLMNGIPQAAALLQIPFSILVNRTHKRKKYMMTLGLFSRAIWLVFGFIPLVVPASPATLRVWTLVFLLGISSCCGAVINVCWLPWLSDLAPSRIQSRWFSYRDVIISAANLLFGLGTAALLDYLPPQNKYIIIFLLGGTLGMLDMICFGFCEEKYNAPPKKLKLGEVTHEIRDNRPFVRFMVMWTAWCFTSNLCGPYLGRYSVSEMGLTFMQMTIFSTVLASVATMFFMPRWGKALNQFGSRSVLRVAATVTALTDAFYLLSVPGSVLPVLLRNLVGAMFWSGCNLSANSLQLSTTPDDTRPSYIAIFACVTSLLGSTLGTMAGGTLLDGFERAGWFPEGAWLDRFKVLILISVALRMLVALLLVPRLENDRDGTPAQLMHAIRQKAIFWKK